MSRKGNAWKQKVYSSVEFVTEVQSVVDTFLNSQYLPFNNVLIFLREFKYWSLFAVKVWTQIFVCSYRKVELTSSSKKYHGMNEILSEWIKFANF